MKHDKPLLDLTDPANQIDELQGQVNELTEALDNVERGQMVILSKLDTVITMLSQVLNTK